MQIKAEEISKIIEDQIKNYEQRVEMSETGTVLYVGDGIARVYGVQNAMAMELLADAYKIGFWEISQKDDGGCTVLFNAQVPASISPEDLKTCCEAVIEAADRLERKWSDSDSL